MLEVPYYTAKFRTYVWVGKYIFRTFLLLYIIEEACSGHRGGSREGARGQLTLQLIFADEIGLFLISGVHNAWIEWAETPEAITPNTRMSYDAILW